MARLNYNHLRYFWAVAHEGNLTRAAEQLSVSQSALSVQIRKLEEQLGHALFERRGKQLLLTGAGRIALDHADAIFAAGDELLGTLDENVDLTRLVLRVGALSTLSRNLQITFLKPLLQRTDVELVLRSGGLGDLLRQLEAHRLDVILLNTLPQRDVATPWIAHPIAEQPLSLVGCPGRVHADDDLRSLVMREPLILPTVESSLRTSFDAVMDRLGLHVRVVAEVEDVAMMRLLAREDLGLALVPPIVVQDELASGQLVEALEVPRLRESFFALTLARRFPNPLLESLIGPS